MSLTSGTRLGPYEVLDLIGALRLRSGQAGGLAFASGWNMNELPAFARTGTMRELRRGLAEAKTRSGP
jgi:hypothetical protein